MKTQQLMLSLLERRWLRYAAGVLVSLIMAQLICRSTPHEPLPKNMAAKLQAHTSPAP